MVILKGHHWGYAMIVDSEWTFRENRKLRNRLKEGTNKT